MPSIISLIVFISSLVGLGLGQSAKITLTYPPAPAVVTNLASPPSTCQVEVAFFDSNSNLVKSQTVSLVPGQSAQVTLTRSELGGPPSAIHPLFWAEAGLVDNCNNSANCDYTLCNIRATGEQADSSNSTNLVMDNLIRFARLGSAPY
ncbi:MAG: hypothetical protein WBM24_12445 [Candidatus Sulfotelmatobacter sp.]